MGWNELLYRVRRRANDDESEAALVERFHQLQEQIDYYEGWTASEGAAIGRSYCRFVREVKEQTGVLIREAWKLPGRDACEPAGAGDVHPDLHSSRCRFLTDVRWQLSLFLLPRFFVSLRNPSREKGRHEAR